MRLSDLMSSMGLDAYATVSLVIFLVVFASVVVRVLMMSRRDARDAAQLPLDDSTTPRQPWKETRHG
ncbi:MAG: hypothetical protein R3B57_09580 [Phycisphaerales bacterium]